MRIFYCFFSHNALDVWQDEETAARISRAFSSTLKHGSYTQVNCSWLMRKVVKEVPYTPVSDIGFSIGKETKAKSRSNYQRYGLTTSEAKSGEAAKV